MHAVRQTGQSRQARNTRGRWPTCVALLRGGTTQALHALPPAAPAQQHSEPSMHTNKAIASTLAQACCMPHPLRRFRHAAHQRNQPPMHAFAASAATIPTSGSNVALSSRRGAPENAPGSCSPPALLLLFKAGRRPCKAVRRDAGQQLNSLPKPHLVGQDAAARLHGRGGRQQAAWVRRGKSKRKRSRPTRGHSQTPPQGCTTAGGSSGRRQGPGGRSHRCWVSRGFLQASTASRGQAPASLTATADDPTAAPSPLAPHQSAPG